MLQSTLCYLENEKNEYLMLHRVKKENDANRDKWIGIGGKFEDGESPEECVLRETREETGLTLTDYRYRGLVTFVSDRWETEYMHLSLRWICPSDVASMATILALEKELMILRGQKNAGINDSRQTTHEREVTIAQKDNASGRL